MKKILVIHSTKDDLKDIAVGIAKGARSNGHQVDIKGTDTDDPVISFAMYDLVIAGSPTQGIFKGKVAQDIGPFLRECKRTEGKDAVAFVTPSFFATTKALKKLMGLLEKQGCFVKNFVTLRSKADGFDYGKKL